MKKILKIAFIIAFSAFTLLTLFLSTSVIFDLFGIRAKEGNYVLFVVQANFVSSLLYLTAIFGIIKQKKWAVIPVVLSLVVLLLAQTGLYNHINNGGIYETKTVSAMYFRMTLTMVFGIITYLLTKKKKIN